MADDNTQGGTKLDTGKLPVELLSPIALLAITKVLAFGAKKYSPNNWRKGLAHTRIIAAMLRHIFAHLLGQDLDPETQLPHADHLACEAMFLSELIRTRPDLDDRYKLDPAVQDKVLAELLGVIQAVVSGTTVQK